MSLELQIAIVVLSLLFLLFVFKLVSRGRLQLKYSLLWIGLVIASVVCAVVPQIVYALSAAIGFITPSNFVFLIAIAFLLAIALSLSSIVSKQSASIKNLVQEIALLRSEFEMSAKKEHRQE